MTELKARDRDIVCVCVCVWICSNWFTKIEPKILGDRDIVSSKVFQVVKLFVFYHNGLSYSVATS